MMRFLLTPKDIWITLDGALQRSFMTPEVAAGAAIAAAISAGSKELVETFKGLSNETEAKRPRLPRQSWG